MSQPYRTPNGVIQVQDEPGDNGGDEKRFVHGLPLAISNAIVATASHLATVVSTLSTVSGSVDGLETLATALNGFVDGIEGFVDGIEGKLQAIADKQDPPATIYHGAMNVTTPGNRVALSGDSKPLTEGVSIRGKDLNTGLIYIGTVTVDSSNGDRVEKKERMFLKAANLNQVYIDAAVGGEGITFSGW